MKMISLTMVRATIVDEDEIEREVTSPVRVNPVYIRSMNPRKEDKPGSRITFADGGGFAVSETLEQIEAAIERAA
ncbi:hypothetical protein PQJ75_00750 [Rhodoplanes sp. TEM]|uniref:Uncharacterized protein n=1 Tax=Rhodoplanes tepidamans TaxID=200616 RepID=A0ABT5J582_RHOTP|nr:MULTISPECIES: hypothetical protein [Rhodoplanes]MDC7784781.1 hypothetical protein [Rhodoplanes tepidamans]MDC7982248.1 hypothetical protein [Rhodoplanes sp. TEM]MDQ0356255.1 hypothetical protein [Rhodoplanes tepidamans]